MNRTLFAINIASLIIGISYGLHAPVLPIFAEDVIGATYYELGLIGLATFVPYMFIPFFVGILLARINNWHLLSVGIAINSSSVYLLSVAQSVPEIMGYRVMAGIAHAFFWPPCESIISNESTEKNRIQNISQFTMFFVTGFMIGPLLGALLLQDVEITYRILFQIAAFILAAAIIFVLFASKKSVKRHQDRSLFLSIRKIRKFPEVLVLVLFCTFSFGVIITIYPAFLNDNGLSAVDILFLYFVFGISRIVSLGLIKKFRQRTSHTLIAVVIAISAGFAISVVADSIAVFAIALVLFGFGISVFSPLTLEIILSRTPKSVSGGIIGAYETGFGMGWAMGPTISGSVAQVFGNEMPYIVLCAAGIGVALFTIMVRKRLEPQSFWFNR